MISKEQFPFYVLNIQIDPSQIDINIHPTKTEVKFEDEKNVYAAVFAGHNVASLLASRRTVDLALRFVRVERDAVFHVVCSSGSSTGGRQSMSCLMQLSISAGEYKVFRSASLR